MEPSNLPFGFVLPGHAHMSIPPTPNLMSSTHPGPTASPPQSVPGRRTPLGSVGLGGFYAQGLSLAQQQQPADENKPGPSELDQKSPTPNTIPMAMMLAATGGMTTAALGGPSGSGASGSGAGSSGSGGAGGKQKNRQGKTVRLNINAR